MVCVDKYIHKTYYMLIGLMVLLLPQAFILPIECSYENHLLENLEVFVLGIGFINMLYKTANLNKDKINKFYLACGIFYIVMIARELSYGRVFYPIGMDKNGEQIFVKVHELWYGSVVYPIVGILILIALILLVVYFYQSRRQGICWYIPLGEFLFFIVTSILSQCVFDRGLVQFGNYNQLLEESCEIIAYISLVCCTYDIFFKRRYIHIRYFSIR